MSGWVIWNRRPRVGWEDAVPNTPHPYPPLLGLHPALHPHSPPREALSLGRRPGECQGRGPEPGCSWGSGSVGITASAGACLAQSSAPWGPQQSRASAPILLKSASKPWAQQTCRGRKRWGRERLHHMGHALASVRHQSVWAQGHSEVGRRPVIEGSRW